MDGPPGRRTSLETPVSRLSKRSEFGQTGLCFFRLYIGFFSGTQQTRFSAFFSMI